MLKTNVMRLLDAAGIPYDALEYAVDESDLSGESTAKKLSLPKETVFKTLALSGEKAGVFLCVIPCHEEIDLKKAAQAAGEKKAAMLPMKELLPLTGYVRGGCSPIGTKRQYPVFIDESCLLWENIAVSAGARGAMVWVSPSHLIKYIGATVADLTVL